jgi:hypothetical protein
MRLPLSLCVIPQPDMITEAVLATYRQIGGDLEGIGRWVRLPPDQPGLEQQLYALAQLLQQVEMVKQGHVADAFADRIRREVERATASPEIAAQVWELAGQ